MKVNYRRMSRLALLAALLIVVALLASYVAHNFFGKGPIPTRSAFWGRLPGVQEGNMRRFQFFYATNRRDVPETFQEQGHELGQKILTGTFDVLISPYLPILPHVWFDKENMLFAGHQPIVQAAFLKQLDQAVQASPEKSLLVIVWGFRDWFRSAALKTAYTAFLLDINTPTLLFDWPGNQGQGRSGYLASREMVAQSANDLAAVLTTVVKNTGVKKIWLLGSSLGCQTICDAFAQMTNTPEWVGHEPKIEYVVLSAPDVSAQSFDEKFADRIHRLSKYLTVYVSSNDRALLMSHWLNRDRRLGRKAQVMIPPEDRSSDYEFEEAAEILDLQAKGLRNTSIVDASPINRTRNLHHFFTDSSEFFDDLYRRLLQPENTVSRVLHEVRWRQGVTYWILWGG